LSSIRNWFVCITCIVAFPKPTIVEVTLTVPVKVGEFMVLLNLICVQNCEMFKIITCPTIAGHTQKPFLLETGEFNGALNLN
jgi:hypothetical protein